MTQRRILDYNAPLIKIIIFLFLLKGHSLMTNRSFTLPLSRWHHIADRVRQIAESKTNEAINTLQNTTLTNVVSDVQKEALKARGMKALLAVKNAREAIEVVGVIREELAKANAEMGVNILLSSAESKRKQAQFLRKFASIDLITKVAVDDVNSVLATVTNSKDRDYYGQQKGLSASLIDVNAFADFEMQAAALESDVASITDQVADVNRHTISILLPAELAKAVGLS